MLLTLDEGIANDLKVLGTFPVDVVQEICKVSGDGIFKEINPKLFNSAATKLGTTSNVVKGIVEGLMKLFVEASKLQLQRPDFLLSLKVLDLPDAVGDELLDRYLEKTPEIRELLKMKGRSGRSYRDLEWRLDVKIATRSARRQVEPKVVLKLFTEADDIDAPGADAVLLQADPSNLKHLARTLEEALREIEEQSHCRRILRNF